MVHIGPTLFDIVALDGIGPGDRGVSLTLCVASLDLRSGFVKATLRPTPTTWSGNCTQLGLLHAASLWSASSMRSSRCGRFVRLLCAPTWSTPTAGDNLCGFFDRLLSASLWSASSARNWVLDPILRFPSGCQLRLVSYTIGHTIKLHHCQWKQSSVRVEWDWRTSPASACCLKRSRRSSPGAFEGSLIP
jgi:hypothetical protein